MPPSIVDAFDAALHTPMPYRFSGRQIGREFASCISTGLQLATVSLMDTTADCLPLFASIAATSMSHFAEIDTLRFPLFFTTD